jgi:hypothetical protein
VSTVASRAVGFADVVAEYEAATFPEASLTALWLLGRVPADALAAVAPGTAVLRPGRAGRGPGPDVREATLLLPSGATLTGDVEVHLRASDFVRHGHATDPAYAGVILHLCWDDDRAEGLSGTPTPLPPRPVSRRAPSSPRASVAIRGAAQTVAQPVAPQVALTVALAPVLRDASRVEALVARGPSGAEPCSECVAARGAEATADLLREEGRKRLAERAWRAWRLADRYGFAGALDLLLERALASTAGRAREDSARREGLAAAVRARLGEDAVAGLAARAHAAQFAHRAGGGTVRAAPLVEAFQVPGIGAGRAAELGWNVALPLLAALAAAYDDVELARVTALLADCWPSPRPYGRTRTLAAGIGVRATGALHAQGLLHLQDLWCGRGGCGLCPLSPRSPATAEQAEDGRAP